MINPLQTAANQSIEMQTAVSQVAVVAHCRSRIRLHINNLNIILSVMETLLPLNGNNSIPVNTPYFNINVDSPVSNTKTYAPARPPSAHLRQSMRSAVVSATLGRTPLRSINANVNTMNNNGMATGNYRASGNRGGIARSVLGRKWVLRVAVSKDWIHIFSDFCFSLVTFSFFFEMYIALYIKSSDVSFYFQTWRLAWEMRWIQSDLIRLWSTTPWLGRYVITSESS